MLFVNISVSVKVIHLIQLYINGRVLKCEDAPTLILSSTVGRVVYAEMTGYSLSTLASRFCGHH